MEHRVVTRRRMRSRPGQGLVEFVLIAPLLMLLIFGLIEFARAWNVRHVVTDAAREGARTIAVWSITPYVPSAAQDSARRVIESALRSNGMNPALATITPVAPASSGDAVTVSISYPYDFGIVKAILAWTTAQGHVDIQTVFTMRKE